jgi:hypothetical protein
MPSPEEAVLMGMAAGEDARRALRRRGIDPARCAALIGALETGVTHVVGVPELHRLGYLALDIEAWRTYVAETRRQLDESPFSHGPRPPRLASLQLLRDLAVARDEREIIRGALESY